jgi:hypothetical protein
MLIQAHAHNMRELVPRIEDFLVPNTRMLSLGSLAFSAVANLAVIAGDGKINGA